MYLNLLKVVVLLSLLFIMGLSQQDSGPGQVKIGSIFTIKSINGGVANIAMRAAVDDVNSNPRILGGRELVLTTSNSNFSGFNGIIRGLEFMADDIVAVVGPQTSEMAHILSHLANELHVPMLSFTALDPTLSSLQYPYFVQTAPNDLYQMTAIADMIRYFGYKDVVVIYTDDDQNRGSMAALGDKLAERLCRITYKAVLPPNKLTTANDIVKELVKISGVESRVVVVHAFEGVGREVFRLAHSQGMIEKGYVWIATTWLSTVADSRPVAGESAKAFEGVLTLRPYTPDSKRKRAFLSRWKHLSNGSIGWNPYGLYAYDTVMIIANAVGQFLRTGGNISFSCDPAMTHIGGSLSALTKFDGGKQVLDNILNTSMTGLSGQIAFQQDRSMIHPAFDILNVNGTRYRNIGYWSNYSGLSIVPPEELYDKPANHSSANQHLHSVMWPGGTVVQPRGWVFSNNGRPLRIGIPNRVSYEVFVSKDEDTNEIRGYCIDVFLAAIKLLPYKVPLEFIPYGDGLKDPNYTDLVTLITTGVFDAAVGDITVITSRTKKVDFTQPYIESGLLVVVQIRNQGSSAWAFLQPFTAPMWAVTGLFFIMVGIVVWILEHRLNDEFRGPPRQQLITLLWFGFSTMFFAQRENTVSALGRMILLIWLFVVLIITSSYTASLTSMLAMQQLAPSIKGIESLINSDDLIGVQGGSFVANYLNEELHIAKSRLVSLETPEECADALETERVSAIVDERPYMDLFLSNYCMFQAVGQEFTKSGWGFMTDTRFYKTSYVKSKALIACAIFLDTKTTAAPLVQAFPRNSPLAIDMTTTILMLQENGELKRLHDKWLKTEDCSQENKAESDELQLISFSGLFLLSGTASFLALIICVCKIIIKYRRNISQASESSTLNGSRPTKIQRFLSFFDHKEEEPDRRSKRKLSESMTGGLQPSKSDILDERPNASNGHLPEVEIVMK